MQQEIRPESDPMTKRPAPGRGEPYRQARKPQASQARAPGSLTARMMDYRSWWNLPGAKPKSARP